MHPSIRQLCRSPEPRTHRADRREHSSPPDAFVAFLRTTSTYDRRLLHFSETGDTPGFFPKLYVVAIDKLLGAFDRLAVVLALNLYRRLRQVRATFENKYPVLPHAPNPRSDCPKSNSETNLEWRPAGFLHYRIDCVIPGREN